MLNIIIELHPFGDASKKRVLETFQICNDGTGGNKYGNYSIRFRETDPWEPVVKAHDRREDADYLVYKALHAIYGEHVASK